MLIRSTAGAGAPSVVVSVKPLHAITAAVTAGIATPRLLVKGSASPHDYAMRPSDAAALNEADLIVWLGEIFETFLAKPLDALAGDAEVVTLMSLAGPDGDPHIWLDPAQARKIAERVAAALSRIDPHTRGRYMANVADFSARLDLLDAELRATLTPVAALPYLVYHDAYGYFVRRYGLAKAGAVFDEPAWIENAEAVFRFVTDNMTEGEESGGRLKHSWCAGKLKHPAILDDYANMARAALMLHELHGGEDYLAHAKAWVAAVEDHFSGPDQGGYFFSSDRATDVIARLRHGHDNAVPSGNGVMVGNLIRLWLLNGEDGYRQRAEGVGRAAGGECG